MMNFIKRYGIFSLLVLIALILLASKAIIWGLAAMGIALFIFGIQQLINLNVKVTQFEGDVVRLEDRNKALLKEKLKLE